MTIVYDPLTYRTLVSRPGELPYKFWSVNKLVIDAAAAGLCVLQSSDAAPSDTTKLWLDLTLPESAVGAVKAYSGGAWVALTPQLFYAHIAGGATGYVTDAEMAAYISGLVGMSLQAWGTNLDSWSAIATSAKEDTGIAATLDAAHVADPDPHPQYLTPAEGNAAYDALGSASAATSTAAAALAAHEAAANPHPGYLTPAEGDAAYSALGHAHTASNVSDFSEAVDDRVAALLVAGSNVTLTYNDGAGTLTVASSGGGGGGGLSDADYGDITVSGGGTVMTVDNGTISTAKIADEAITYAKIQNISAADKLLGRFTGGAGSVEEITCTAAGRALLDDASAAAQRATLSVPTFGAFVSVKDPAYGAVGDGATNDATAIQAAATAAAGGNLYLPPGNYLWGSTSSLTIPDGTVIWGYAATLTKGANCDLISPASNVKINGLTIQGAGATYTGRGIVVSNTSYSDQVLNDVKITDMNGYCLECSPDAGIRLLWNGGFAQRTTPDNPAIRFAGGGGTETAGERKLIGLQGGGGWGPDTAGSQNTHLIGCSFKNMTMGAASAKTILSGNRFATVGTDVTVDGTEHALSGNIIAAGITIASGATYNRIGANTLTTGSTITDSSGNATNRIAVEAIGSAGTAFGAVATPSGSWKGDTTDPALGNGSATYKATVDGNFLWFYIEVTIGSTTTFGTGNWYFTMPSPYNGNAAASATGSAFVLDAGTALYLGTAYIASGTNKVYVIAHNSANFFNSTVPFTWASGDYMRLSIRFPIR